MDISLGDAHGSLIYVGEDSRMTPPAPSASPHLSVIMTDGFTCATRPSAITFCSYAQRDAVQTSPVAVRIKEAKAHVSRAY